MASAVDAVGAVSAGFSGELQKKGRVCLVPTWQRRFFELCGNTLTWRHSESVRKRNSGGRVIAIVALPDRGGSKRANRFDILILEQSGVGAERERYLEVAARSAELQRQWLAALAGCSPGVRRIPLGEHPRIEQLRRHAPETVAAAEAVEMDEQSRRADETREAQEPEMARRRESKAVADEAQAVARKEAEALRDVCGGRHRASELEVRRVEEQERRARMLAADDHCVGRSEDVRRQVVSAEERERRERMQVPPELEKKQQDKRVRDAQRWAKTMEEQARREQMADGKRSGHTRGQSCQDALGQAISMEELARQEKMQALGRGQQCQKEDLQHVKSLEEGARWERLSDAARAHDQRRRDSATSLALAKKAEEVARAEQQADFNRRMKQRVDQAEQARVRDERHHYSATQQARVRAEEQIAAMAARQRGSFTHAQWQDKHGKWQFYGDDTKDTVIEAMHDGVPSVSYTIPSSGQRYKLTLDYSGSGITGKQCNICTGVERSVRFLTRKESFLTRKESTLQEENEKLGLVLVASVTASVEVQKREVEQQTRQLKQQLALQTLKQQREGEKTASERKAHEQLAKGLQQQIQGLQRKQKALEEKLKNERELSKRAEKRAQERRKQHPERFEDCLLFLDQTCKLDAKFFCCEQDRCYCPVCYTAAPVLHNAGPEPYVIPRGWTRFGLAVPAGRAAALRVWENWCVSYFGHAPDVVKSLLLEGSFRLPGDKLRDGTMLRAQKCAGRQERQFYTSPTISYSGLGFYAEPREYTARDGTRRYGQVVLQCRQDPSSFRKQGETMRFGANTQLCEHTETHLIERVSEQPGCIIPYGLLVRTFAQGKDPPHFRSKVDPACMVPWKS